MKNELNILNAKKTTKEKWIIRNRFYAGRMIPVVSADLNSSDIIGGWKVRWGVNRNDYRVCPGIYSLGNPDERADVLVTANYKLTFDKLRKELKGMNIWILVLDTDGVNVWCAAGKGTFGTAELISRIKSSGLESIISHKRLILPQLGAPGIESHIVKDKSGFNVVYGPVYAKDLKQFIANGYRKDEKMKIVRFDLADRMAVAPIELVLAAKYVATSVIIFGI
nr:acetyl-CoA synthase subunit gamma [Spirochaetota bacterium]